MGAIERGHQVHIYPLNLNQPSANLAQIKNIVQKNYGIESIFFPPTIPKNYLLRLAKGLKLFLTNLHRGAICCLPLLNFVKYGQGDLFLTNCEFFRQQLIKLGCNQDKIMVHGSGIDCEQSNVY